MINPIKYAFIQRTDLLGEPSVDLVEICYAHECIWLTSQNGPDEDSVRIATRYEFDFATPEMAYMTAKRMVELLEQKFPDIQSVSAECIRERVY